MSIDLHDPVSAGQHVAKQARKRAIKTVEAARDVDLHGPAQAAKKVAKGTAKRAAREAATAAKRASTGTKRRASSRLVRVVLAAVVAGAVVGVAIAAAQRMRRASAPHRSEVAPDPFGSAMTERDPEILSV